MTKCLSCQVYMHCRERGQNDMPISQFWSHSNGHSLVSVVEIYNILPPHFNITILVVTFHEIILDIFKQMWWIIDYKYPFIVVHNIWFLDRNFLKCLQESSLIGSLITNQSHYV